MLGVVSVKEIRGIVSDVMEKCSGKDGRSWLVAAKRFLRGDNPWLRPWKVSFRSDLGVLFDLDQILEQIGRFRLTETAERVIRGPGTSFRMGSGNLVGQVHFVELTPWDLGFKEQVSVDRLVEKAAENGLVPCPPEIALHLPSCASVHDLDRSLHVVSQAVVVMEREDGSSRSSPYRFSVALDDVPCLRAGFMSRYESYDRVLFALPDFAVRWTVTLGECREMELLERLLSVCVAGRFTIMPDVLVALDPSKGFSVETEPTRVDLVTVSVGELGFLTQATYEQIVERAASFGLGACPAEVVPTLVLEQDGRFPAAFGEDKVRYFVATESATFVLEDGSLNVFRTERHFFRPDAVFVFVKPREDEAEE